jgi:hypothetical protein
MTTNSILLCFRYSSSVWLMFLTHEFLKLVFVTIYAPVSISIGLYIYMYIYTHTLYPRSLTLPTTHTLNRKRYHADCHKYIHIYITRTSAS